MNELNDFVIAGLGIATVFVALVCIILICNVMGAIFKRVPTSESKTATKTKTDEGSVEASEPLVQAQPQAIQTQNQFNPRYVRASIKNRGEVVSAIAAVIAEDCGVDVSHIRIHSIRERADVINNRAEICAIASAVIALDTGAEAVRIHSIRKVENRGALCAAIGAAISLDTGADAVRIHSIRRV